MNKILIVMKQADLRADLKRLFTLNGDKIFQATSGVDAINIMLMISMDVVICDQDIDYGNGNWLMERSKALRSMPKFIFITESAVKDSQKYLFAGALGFYHRPIIVEELYKFVNGII